MGQDVCEVNVVKSEMKRHSGLRRDRTRDLAICSQPHYDFAKEIAQ